MGKYLSFLPSYVLPPLVAMGAVYAYTHLLDPAEYGIYALVLSVVQLALSVLFSWLQLGVKRFYPQAKAQGRLGILAVNVYAGYAFCAVLALAGFAVLLVFQTDSHMRWAYGLGGGLLLARSLALIGKAFQLSALHARRYSLMECGESLIGFLAGLVLIWLFGWGTDGVIVGLAIGALASVAIDLPALRRRLAGGALDRVMVQDIFRFAAPMTYGYALEFVMSSSNRFFIQHYLGEGAVGIYSVSYTLSDRCVSIVFQALAVVAYPLLMTALEKGGADGARRQLRANCELILALAVPAWVGFLVVSPQIASVLTGAAFSTEAGQIMPWVSTAVFLSCWRQHYIDHAFHLARRTEVYIYTAGPPAVLNVVLNIVLLPVMGTQGAVVATVASYAFAFCISLGLSRRLFPLPFPWTTAAKVALASLVMGGTLHSLAFASTAAGLAEAVLTGGAIYAAMALVLNLGDSRHRLLTKLSRVTAGK